MVLRSRDDRWFSHGIRVLRFTKRVTITALRGGNSNTTFVVIDDNHHLLPISIVTLPWSAVNVFGSGLGNLEFGAL